ncbi:MAG TPA: deoxyribose-phosphate aldolase [Steroidobacteraceae bacterium]|nr:deoxyribose-phosphate aldolase [Steroidobacteraceae bacterium]
MPSNHSAVGSVRASLAQRLLSLVDLTSLNASDDEATIRKLSGLADTAAGRVAAVCTWRRLVPVARAALQGRGIAVAAVANFPAGAADIEAAAAETAAAIAAGADEVDVVFPYREFLAGHADTGLQLVRACRAACGDRALLKVILETGQIAAPERIRRAAGIAIEGGAQFLKTSTGKTEPGATVEAATVLLEAIGDAANRGLQIGFKASGGIRSIEQAQSYLQLYENRFGAESAKPENFRIGASALIHELLAQLQ